MHRRKCFSKKFQEVNASSILIRYQDCEELDLEFLCNSIQKQELLCNSIQKLPSKDIDCGYDTALFQKSAIAKHISLLCTT